MPVAASHQVLFAIIAALVCASCGRDPGPAEARIALTRQYRLVLNSRGIDPQLVSSDLTLDADGRFVQRCRFKNKPPEQVSGTWSFDPPHNVRLSRFNDCARVFGAAFPHDRDTGASLIVEFHDPPIIVLNPDMVGVFYEGLR